MAPTADEPSLASAADELAELLSEGAMQDRLILQRLPGLLTVLESAGLRLISFCQCFPERFSLRFLPGWGVRVSLEPASSEPTLDLPLVENVLEAVVVQHVERYHDKHSANEKAPAAPIGWLIRRIGPELDAYIAQAARGPLHFQLDPEASGFANLRLALRGCVACHVCEFVHARSEVFSWVEGPPCDGGAHASCHCQGAIALTPERAAAVMAARRARLKADEVKREVKREALRPVVPGKLCAEAPGHGGGQGAAAKPAKIVPFGTAAPEPAASQASNGALASYTLTSPYPTPPPPSRSPTCALSLTR